MIFWNDVLYQTKGNITPCSYSIKHDEKDVVGINKSDLVWTPSIKSLECSFELVSLHLQFFTSSRSWELRSLVEEGQCMRRSRLCLCVARTMCSQLGCIWSSQQESHFGCLTTTYPAVAWNWVPGLHQLANHLDLISRLNKLLFCSLSLQSPMSDLSTYRSGKERTFSGCPALLLLPLSLFDFSLCLPYCCFHVWDFLMHSPAPCDWW